MIYSYFHIDSAQIESAIVYESDDSGCEFENYYQPIRDPENDFSPIPFFMRFTPASTVFEVIGYTEQ